MGARQQGAKVEEAGRQHSPSPHPSFQCYMCLDSGSIEKLGAIVSEVNFVVMFTGVTVRYVIFRFADPTPYGLERDGHCRGGLQTQKPDGFTKSTAVHSLGPDINTTATLRRLEPYVAR